MIDRTRSLQVQLVSRQLQAVVLVSPANIAYLTGFRPTPLERLTALVVPALGNAALVLPALEKPELPQGTADNVELFPWKDEAGPGEALAASLKNVDGAIAIEKASMTVRQHELLIEAWPNARFEDCGNLVVDMRVIKDESELAAIRETAAIADRAIADLRDHMLQPGRSEIELVFACVETLRENGCQDWLQHPPVILTGAHSALPHGRPGPTRVNRGDLLIVDIGFASGGYWADITRTFVVGAKPDRRQLELFRIVAAAQQAAIAAAVPEGRCADVDKAAREVIADAGYANQFVHRTGHGLGLEVHEAPFLHAKSAEVLAPGMVITAEPGIYIPGYGGVRLEDDLAIGPKGATRLTQSPVDLASSI